MRQPLMIPASRAVGRRAAGTREAGEGRAFCARGGRRGCPVFHVALPAVLGLLAGSGAWATNITSCPYTITQPGDYHVTQDLFCPGSNAANAAITIVASNVTLSLDGHTLTGSGASMGGSGEEGIWVKGQSGVSIANGTIANFGSGVLLSEAPGCTVSGLTTEHCSDGIQVDPGSNGSSITGNTCNNGIPVSVGIEVIGASLTSSDNIQVTNNICTGNAIGIEIESASNTITGNTALNNTQFDLDDDTVSCSHNVWMGNCFGTASKPCIGISTCGQSSITCPPDQTVTVPATSHPTATVDPGTPTSSLTGVPIVGVRSDGKALTDPYPVGTTTITWTVNPGQENAATCTQTITVRVGNALQITCPPNLTVTAPLGQNSATVVVGMATANLEVALVGVRSDGKALTAPYPIGTTTITWMATFDEQAPVSCTQTIIVQAAVSTPAIIRGPNQADPHLDSILVNRGPIYQRAILHGRGFADVQGTSYVTLGGNQIPVLAWSNDAIDVLILPQAYRQAALALNAAYPVQVVITANGKKSNTVDFFLTDGPPPN